MSRTCAMKREHSRARTHVDVGRNHGAREAGLDALHLVKIERGGVRRAHVVDEHAHVALRARRYEARDARVRGRRAKVVRQRIDAGRAWHGSAQLRSNVRQTAVGGGGQRDMPETCRSESCNEKRAYQQSISADKARISPRRSARDK